VSAPASIAPVQRVAGRPPPQSRLVDAAQVLALAGLAAFAAYLTTHRVERARVAETSARLGTVNATFALLRTRTSEQLREHGRILAEDARLKSTLNTEGIDEETVADNLRQIRCSSSDIPAGAPCDRAHADEPKQATSLRGMLVVLTTDGRVLAEAGAPELRHLDLSGSAVVKHAKTSSTVVTGSWVIGTRLIDLAIVPVRFDDVIGYLVVGRAVDQALMRSLAEATAAEVGIAIGAEWALVSSDWLAAVPSLAMPTAPGSRVFEQDGREYVAAFFELEQAGQARPRLVAVRSLESTRSGSDPVIWMIWLTPLLVLIAGVLLSFGVRRNR
jgi:hypothetical protein